MEVFPCSSVHRVGEADGPQQISRTTLTYDGHSNGLEIGKQAQGEVHAMLAKPSAIDGHHSESSCFEANLDVRTSSTNLLNVDDHFAETNQPGECDNSHLPFGNSVSVVNSIEGEIYNQDGDLSFPKFEWLGRDESIALWVKLKGKWHAGIRCERADWPLSMLKEKPTHDQKKYIVIFFPHTKNYSWGDVQLVCSINESPMPIEYNSHNVGLEMVKDLTVARRFLLQNLAVGMLNVIDQINIEALKDSARDATVWKEFAMEASNCIDYPDLGKMLLKLRNMILDRYINQDWLHNSYELWVKGCHNAHSAECIELLKEELSTSILWKELNSLSFIPTVLPALGSEWKQEVMKLFSTLHPIPIVGDTELTANSLLSSNGELGCNGPLTSSTQMSRKRPKLEIRRAELHVSQVGIIDTNDGNFDNRDKLEAAVLTPKPCKEDLINGSTPTDSSFTAVERWGEIVVQTGNLDFVQSKNLELTPVDRTVAERSLDSANKNRQCIAFIEAKGRQCVRLANEGDVYCCVHLASRFIGKSARGEGTPSIEAPMCGGITTLGTKCKHRSLQGSPFCKKHRPRDLVATPGPPENKLKRKFDEDKLSTDTAHDKQIVLLREVESPLEVDPVSVMDRYAINVHNNVDMSHCIGPCTGDGNNPCYEIPKRHSLYCDKHLPSWLKRARNGKSRIVSKEVFLELLKECYTHEKKVYLHKACELFYRLFKSIISLRNQVPMEIQLQWAVSEASKDVGVGEYLMKLVNSEKERLKLLWGFKTDNDAQIPSSSIMENTTVISSAVLDNDDTWDTIKCKICSYQFHDDQELGNHFLSNHKKEAKRLFRGYACAICLDSFTNKKIMVTHVQERHHVQFVEKCMLLQCILCRNHHGNTNEFWLHVLSLHPNDLRMSKAAKQNMRHTDRDSSQTLELRNSIYLKNNSENRGSSRWYICKICGFKFDLLPDLDRHHLAAHIGGNLLSSRPKKKGINYYGHRLKSSRLNHPRFRKGLAAASYRIRNRASENMKKRMQASKLISSNTVNVKTDVTQKAYLGGLAEPQLAVVANTLFHKIQKTKARPSNPDILSIARSTCCKVNLQAVLEEKYGVLPERLYLRAAKLCGENNIKVDWHQQKFLCPRGCKSHVDQHMMDPLNSFSEGISETRPSDVSDFMGNDWNMDESHCIIDSFDFIQKPVPKPTVLCNDISFGQETVPVVCVIDVGSVESFKILKSIYDGQKNGCSMPWESFTYVTKPLVDQSSAVQTESLQLGCACPNSTCSTEICDHIYLFDNDYDDAKDIYGKPMHGRFPYDEEGCIILEEGYLIYECNYMCGCSRICRNRVLQNGVQVKLEVFKTEEKGWAVRAGESIMRGMFVCEYIGEVLDEQEANTRRDREGCMYFYTIDAHNNTMSRLIEDQVTYVIDATKYGNVSRFINHSCSPNLMNRQVLVESMECQLAHIGFYASRDIALGEELSIDYQYKLLPGEGCPCLCGASNCKGRL